MTTYTRLTLDWYDNLHQIDTRLYDILHQIDTRLYDNLHQIDTRFVWQPMTDWY